MPRKVFHVLSVLSLMLCLATAALWVCGLLGRGGIVNFTGAHWDNDLGWDNGYVNGDWTGPWPADELQREPGIRLTPRRDLPTLAVPWVSPADPSTMWQHKWGVVGWTAASRYFRFLAPCWFLAAVFAVVPLLRWCSLRGLRRREARARAGLCLACGYNLRMTPQRCPECGRMTAGDPPPPPFRPRARTRCTDGLYLLFPTPGS